MIKTYLKILVFSLFLLQIYSLEGKPEIKIGEGVASFTSEKFGYLRNKNIRPLDFSVLLRETKQNIKEDQKPVTWLFFVGDKQNIEKEKLYIEKFSKIAEQYTQLQHLKFGYSKSGLEGGTQHVVKHIQQTQLPFIFVYIPQNKKYLIFDDDLTQDQNEQSQQKLINIIESIETQELKEINISKSLIKEIHQSDMNIRRKFQEERRKQKIGKDRSEGKDKNQNLTEEEIKELKQRKQKSKEEAKKERKRKNMENQEKREERRQKMEERKKQQKQEDL